MICCCVAIIFDVNTTKRFDRQITAVILGTIVLLALVISVGQLRGISARLTSPRSGMVDTTQPLEIRFSFRMDQGSVVDGLQITPDVPVDVSWNGNTLVLAPEVGWPAGERITVTLAQTIMAANGTVPTAPIVFDLDVAYPSVLTVADSPQGDQLTIVPVDSRDTRDLGVLPGVVLGGTTSRHGDSAILSMTVEETGADLIQVDLESGRWQTLVSCAPEWCLAPAWAPDESLLLFERREDDAHAPDDVARLWLYEFDNDEASPVFPVSDRYGQSPVWSPDGARVAYYDPIYEVVRVFDLAGQGEFQLPAQAGSTGTFSPDGLEMAYPVVRAIGGVFFTQLVTAEIVPNGGFENLLPDGQEDFSPAWSPVSNQVVFARRLVERTSGFGAQMMIYDADTGEITRITNDSNINSSGYNWDFTGRWVMAQRADLLVLSGKNEVWVYDTQTGEFMKLVDGFGIAWIP